MAKDKPSIITGVEQNSEEWMRLRLGSIGGTAINSVMAKGGGKGRKGIMEQLAGEIITGVNHEGVKFQYADRGHEFEDRARDSYSIVKGVDVEQITMIKDGNYKHISPDFIVGDNGLGEIKVRIPSVMVSAINSRHYPTAVKRQIQWGLYVSGREWCDYVQYCPEFADAGINPLLIERIFRDDIVVGEMEDTTTSFIDELMCLVDNVKKKQAG